VKFLVDANVLSEPTKPSPSTSVVEWLRRNEADLVVHSIVLGELEYGILLLPVGRKRSRLERWFSEIVRPIRLIHFDGASASAWARLLAGLKKKGLAMSVKDSLIAATAMAHGLAVATRNLVDFKRSGVELVNPFHY